MRIDKYLKNSRIIKRRTIAKEACVNQRIFVNDKVAKPGTEVFEGDEIEIIFGNKKRRIKVLKALESPKKEEANLMYEDIGME